MMGKILRIIRSNYIAILLFTVLVCVKASCLIVDGVDVPSSVNAGEELTMNMHITITCYADNTSHLVVAILLPKSWEGRQNTSITFTSSLGEGKMSPMPLSAVCPNGNGLPWADALKQKYGIGPNLIDGVEWVVFQSDKTYSVVANQNYTATVKIVSKTGPENRLFKLGFFAGDSQDGLGAGVNGQDIYSSFFTDCFPVINGEGDVIDYCHPQLSTISPVKSLDNDIITLSFNNSIVTTTLSNTDNIYLCATAFTDDGGSVSVCEQTDKTKLTDIGGEKYRIDLWPRGFFNVSDDQTITRIAYYFTDADGNNKVGDNNTTDPFQYIFTCE